MKKNKSKSKSLSTSGAPVGLSTQMGTDTIPIGFHDCPIAVPDNGYTLQYNFIGSCEVDTCQYYSEVTSKKCLILDKKMTSTGLTDREIHYFKIEKSKNIPQDQKPQFRTVNLMRKKAQTSIKANIIFYYFLSWIRENREPEDTPFVYKKGSKKFLESIITEYPFVQEGIDFFEYWMLPFLFDKELYSTFCSTSQTLQIDSSDINLQSVLNLTPVKFSKTHLLIQELADPVYQEDISNSLY